MVDFSEKDRSTYDLTAHLYSLFTGILFSFGGMTEGRLRKRAFIETLPLKGNEKILDICCANGKGTRIIASMIPNGEVYGIDLNPKMLAFATAKSREYPNVKFRVGDCAKIPFKENTFDLVNASLALHELPTSILKKVFNEIRRVLKPGGRLLVLDFVLPNPLPSFLRYFYYAIRIIEDESAARFMMIDQQKLLARENFKKIHSKSYYAKLLGSTLYELIK